MYEGSDKAVNLRSAFGNLAKEFSALKSFKLPFPNRDGSFTDRPLKFFLIGKISGGPWCGLGSGKVAPEDGFLYPLVVKYLYKNARHSRREAPKILIIPFHCN